ncbi:hypothetical protein P3T24_005832 [Paraburkholderia sp. GAS33]
MDTNHPDQPTVDAHEAVTHVVQLGFTVNSVAARIGQRQFGDRPLRADVAPTHFARYHVHVI